LVGDIHDGERIEAEEEIADQAQRQTTQPAARDMDGA
jgi:hypothetical protein